YPLSLHDALPIFGTSLGERFSLAAIEGQDNAAELVGNLRGAFRVLLEDDGLMAGLEQLLGEVVTDLAPADDHDVHLKPPVSSWRGARRPDELPRARGSRLPGRGAPRADDRGRSVPARRALRLPARPGTRGVRPRA